MKKFSINNENVWFEIYEFLTENGYEFEEMCERGDDIPHTIIVSEEVYERLFDKFDYTVGNDVNTINYLDLDLDEELIVTITKLNDFSSKCFIQSKEELQFDLDQNYNSSLRQLRKWLMENNERIMTIHILRNDEIFHII